MTDRAIERCPQQSDLDGLKSYREFIEHTETSSMDQKVVEQLLRLILKKLDGSKNAITAIEKGSSKGSIDSLAVERFPAVVEIA